VNRDIIGGRFQAAGDIVGGKSASQVDWDRPFYEIIRSPSRENLTVAYAPVDYRRWREWDTNDKVISFDYPDGSRMYVQLGYDDADRNYLRQQFWEQRFSRWSKAAAIILAIVLAPPLFYS
jgi:hypothetical protein